MKRGTARFKSSSFKAFAKETFLLFSFTMRGSCRLSQAIVRQGRRYRTNESANSFQGTVLISCNGIYERRNSNENAGRRLERGEYQADIHSGSAFAEGLACAQNVLFAWAALCCDTALSVGQPCSSLVSGPIAAIGRLRITGTTRNDF